MPAAQASHAEMAKILNNSARRQTTHRMQAHVNVLNRIDKSPPLYIAPPSSNIVRSDVIVYPDAPRVSPMRTIEAESKGPAMCPTLQVQRVEE